MLRSPLPVAERQKGPILCGRPWVTGTRDGTGDIEFAPPTFCLWACVQALRWVINARMGKASNRKWVRRYKWPDSAFMALRRADVVRLLCKRVVNAAQDAKHVIPRLYD